MTTDQPVARGIGIGAPGLGRPLPSPGASCVAIVTTTSTETLVWDGYTADDAAANRAARLKDAGVKPVRTGNTVTWVNRDGVKTEIAFTDHQTSTPIPEIGDAP